MHRRQPGTRKTTSLLLLLLVAAVVAAAIGSTHPGAAATTVAPSNTSPPTISGAAIEGSTLTSTHGAFSGTDPITYTSQWRRCDANGGSCSDITGATAATYALAKVDVGNTLRIVVTAKNADGTNSSTSVPTAVVKSSAAVVPRSSGLPTISGSAQDGATLTATSGTWTGSDATYTYRWIRCNANGRNCAYVGGTTADTTHVLAATDVGGTIRVDVTAANAAGSATARSLQTAVVQGKTVTPATGCPTGSGLLAVKDVGAPARLAIDGQSSSPSLIRRSTGRIDVRIHVSACGGRAVAGAMIYVTGVPFNQFSIPAEVATGADGWATLTMVQQSSFPASGRQQLLAMFVRASKTGDPALGGVSSRRLISFPVNLRG